MDDYRLDCLKLAHDLTLRPEDVVARAKAYHDFVVGKVAVDASVQPLSPKVFAGEAGGVAPDA